MKVNSAFCIRYKKKGIEATTDEDVDVMSENGKLKS